MTFDRSPSQSVPDVAFIVYNYTSKLLLKKQLDFFRKTELSFSYSLTVVDDASLDGSRELVPLYPDVDFVFLERFQGHGRAFNRGLAVAPASQYVCLLHTDINLASEALESLVEHCNAHPEVKICAPLITFPWGQPQKFIFNPSLLTMYSGSVDKYLSKSVARRLTSAVQPVRVAGIIGPFLFCSRELVVDSRLYNESFQQYFCDMELAHRLMRQGGQTSFIRDPELYYSMKYAYVKKFYGLLHARMTLRRDSLRARFKEYTYRTLYKIAPSSKLTFQVERYRNLAGTLETVKKCLESFSGGRQ